MRTGTNAAPRRIAMMGPRRKQRASRPTTTSTFFAGSAGIVLHVRWYTKCVISVSNATGSRRIGKMSRKTMPCGARG